MLSISMKVQSAEGWAAVRACWGALTALLLTFLGHSLGEEGQEGHHALGPVGCADLHVEVLLSGRGVEAPTSLLRTSWALDITG